jgi:hypothetical protein
MRICVTPVLRQSFTFYAIVGSYIVLQHPTNRTEQSARQDGCGLNYLRYTVSTASSYATQHFASSAEWGEGSRQSRGKALRWTQGLWWLILPALSVKKQEVLRRTNSVLSSIRHGPHWKRRVQQFLYCWMCIRYRGNVSTEPLPSNDREIFTEPTPSNDKAIFTEPLPRNDRGIFTEPLPSNDRGIFTEPLPSNDGVDFYGAVA